MENTKPPATGLRISDDPMYRLLREGCIKEFNVKRAGGEPVDLTRCDLRGLDLRGLETDGLDFSECYFRQADLRVSCSEILGRCRLVIIPLTVSK